MSSRLFWNAIVLICLSSSAQAGVIEICKDSDPVGSLSGLYSFTIGGQTGTVLVPVGACTDAFLLPDGFAVITEVPVPGSIFESVSTFPDDRLISFDPQLGSATVLIVPGDLSDPSTETLVDFVNTPSAIPEPGTGWVVGSGLALWALCRNLTKRPTPALISPRTTRSGAEQATEGLFFKSKRTHG
jgi:hypothetical protein